MISAFGVEHGHISKANNPMRTFHQASNLTAKMVRSGKKPADIYRANKVKASAGIRALGEKKRLP